MVLFRKPNRCSTNCKLAYLLQIIKKFMNTSFLKNKTVIITGGASGIGRAVAKQACAAGAYIVIADINEPLGHETVSHLPDGQSIFIKTDVTNAQACEQLVKKALEHFGQVDFLCNSAGLQTYGTTESTTEQEWDTTLNINLKSIFLVSKYVLPAIRKSGGGAIVNISSVQGMACQENVSGLRYF